MGYSQLSRRSVRSEPRAIGPEKVPRQSVNYVDRPRLDDGLDLLRSGQRRAVTVWSAAGSGKTNLLSSWARRLSDEGRDVVWFTGAELANTLSPLRRAILRQPQRVSSGLDGLGPSLDGPGSSLDGPARVIFIDDVHAVTLNRIGPQIAAFVEDLPADTAVVLAGRFQPFTTLTFLQASGELSELRTSDLAFRNDEAGTLVERFGYVLDDDAVDALVRRTGGWATALALAIPWLRDAVDRRAAIAQFDGDHRAVADYLVDEVLEGANEEERTMMMSTAIREEIPLQLAVELSGRVDAGNVLHTIAMRNSLLSETATGFRFHPVLLSYLRAECRRRDAVGFSARHQTAASWFAARGEGANALREAMASGSGKAAESVLEIFGLDLALRGETELIYQATTFLPLEHAPLVVVAMNLLLEAPDFADARRAAHLFAEAERFRGQGVAGNAADDKVAFWLAVVDALRCFLPGSNRELSDRLRVLRDAPRLELRRRSLPLDLLASAAEAWGLGQSGEPIAATAQLRDVADSARRAELTWLAFAGNELASRQAAMSGEWTTAALLEDQITDDVLADTHPLRDRVQAAAALIAAGHAYRLCEPMPTDLLDEIITSDPVGAKYGLTVPARIVRQMPLLDTDPNPREVLDTVEALMRDHGRQSPRLYGAVALRLVSLRLDLDGRAEARSIADHVTAVLGANSLESKTVRLALAFPSRVGDADEAQLTDALEDRSPAWHTGAPVGAWLLLAASAERSDRHSEADTRVVNALRLANRTGTFQPFAARGGEGAKLLLTRIGRLGHLDPIARQLSERVEALLPESTRESAAVNFLTPREHEILKELPIHQSVAEIARKQVLSVNTVKTHLRSIYQKLGVADRSDAVVVAQTRGLL